MTNDNKPSSLKQHPLTLFRSNRYGTYDRNVAYLYGTEAAVMLQELIDWHGFQYQEEKTIIINGKPDWFYMTLEKTQQLTGLKRDRQNSAIKTLEQAGLIEVHNLNADSSIKRHFLLHAEKILGFYDLTAEKVHVLKTTKRKASKSYVIKENNTCVENNTCTCGKPPLLVSDVRYNNDPLSMNPYIPPTEVVDAAAKPAAMREIKKLKKRKTKSARKEVPQKESYGPVGNVKLTKEEYAKHVTKYGKERLDKMIHTLDLAISSKGYSYKSHYYTIIQWFEKEAAQAPTQAPVQTSADKLAALIERNKEIARGIYEKHGKNMRMYGHCVDVKTAKGGDSIKFDDVQFEANLKKAISRLIETSP